LTTATESGAAWLACRPSTILPSVQGLTVKFPRESDAEAGSAEALALASALKGQGYCGYVEVVGVPPGGPQRDQIRELLQATAKVTLRWCRVKR
jgi:hypothetical protein